MDVPFGKVRTVDDVDISSSIIDRLMLSSNAITHLQYPLFILIYITLIIGILEYERMLSDTSLNGQPRPQYDRTTTTIIS